MGGSGVGGLGGAGVPGAEGVQEKRGGWVERGDDPRGRRRGERSGGARRGFEVGWGAGAVRGGRQDGAGVPLGGGAAPPPGYGCPGSDLGAPWSGTHKGRFGGLRRRARGTARVWGGCAPLRGGPTATLSPSRVGGTVGGCRRAAAGRGPAAQGMGVWGALTAFFWGGLEMGGGLCHSFPVVGRRGTVPRLTPPPAQTCPSTCSHGQGGGNLIFSP